MTEKSPCFCKPWVPSPNPLIHVWQTCQKPCKNLQGYCRRLLRCQRLSLWTWPWWWHVGLQLLHNSFPLTCTATLWAWAVLMLHGPIRSIMAIAHCHLTWLRWWKTISTHRLHYQLITLAIYLLYINYNVSWKPWSEQKIFWNMPSRIWLYA